MRREEAVITTWTGTHIDLLRPDVAEIHIDDVAMGLVRQARFGGHTTRRYSVAEHLLLGLEVCRPEARWEWFTHDFSEAYLGDVKGPLKASLALAGFRQLESAWEQRLAERFGIGEKWRKEVRTVDARMLVTEQRDLKGRMPRWTDGYKPFSMQIAVREPGEDWLRERFLATFAELAKSTDRATL